LSAIRDRAGSSPATPLSAEPSGTSNTYVDELTALMGAWAGNMPGTWGSAAKMMLPTIAGDLRKLPPDQIRVGIEQLRDTLQGVLDRAAATP
jgi:hypothetical protein